MTCIDILRRAEKWFIGHHTGRWPPDTAQSELESHFHAIADVLVAETFFQANIDGHGRMFFVPDHRRFWDATSFILL